MDVIGVLLPRALKHRYRGSALGVLWSALNPLGMAAVYTAVFGKTFAPYFDGSYLRYSIAVYIGLTLAGFFIGGTTQASTSIVQNGALLNKLSIPFEAFPLAALLASAFQHVVASLPIIAVISLFVNRDPLHVLALLIPVAALAMLSTGVALLISATDVFFRDVPYLYELVTFLLWVTSPVFYPAAIVPERLARYLDLNPLFPILESARVLALTRTWPAPSLFWLALLDGAVALALGLFVFRRLQPKFMDLL
jgi:lipopolysaccharide transport system permease protein